jgi:nicotinamide-nucleotide amidase
MFDECVVEILNQKLPSSLAFVCRTLRSTGVPESIVEERISKPLRSLVRGGLEVGYCARVGQVDVRLSARGSKGEVLVDAAERIVREHLGESIYGTDDDELENAIVRLLMERRQTLAIAESCTGGSLSNRITNVPGSSTVFLAGLVTYSNDAKRDFLGVAKDTLVRDGAVSEPVARAMAEGARRRTGADYALSVTGIAGPGGGTARKPVGTVFIGIAGPDGTSVERHFNPYDRETFKQATAQQALNRLRLSLLARPSAWASQVLLR